ncbi:recombinase family protein [Bacillus cereus]|uniref:recombinase family protein n=1 Tax=Bacillus cereus TaxID=1396 RepID=UPI0035C996BF
MRYAVYVRVSTDKDEQVSSVENQVDICRYWIEKNGYEWDQSAVYFDDGISGTAWLERHAMQLILKKVRKNELDTVVFKSIHRLARDLKDALEIKEILLGHGVRLVTIEEGYDSYYEGNNDMKFEIYAMFAAQLPKTLSTSISAALSAKVRRGEHTGTIPFGYDRIDKKLIINDEEALLVKEMFDWYEDGRGYRMIANNLNKKGCRTRFGNLWSEASVKTIVTNSLYTGEHVMHKYKTVKVDGKKKTVKNPKEKWLVFENHHDAIISKEQWERINPVSGVKDKKTKSDYRNEFRGIVWCAHCGKRVRAIYAGVRSKYERVYMKCSTYKAYGTCVNHIPIRYEDFRNLILERLKQKQEYIETRLVAQIKDKLQGKIAKSKKMIKQLESKKEKLLELYMDSFIDKETFVNRNRKLEDEMTAQELQLLKLKDKDIQNRETKDIQDAFMLLQEEQDLHKAFQKLIKKIVFYQDGKLDIEYTFDI